MRSAVLVLIVTCVIATSACAGSMRLKWTAEVKNSDVHLTEQQQIFLHAAIDRLRRSTPSVSESARTLAVVLHSEILPTAERDSAAARLAADLTRLLSDDAEMMSVVFSAGDYLMPVAVSREHFTISSRTNFEMREPGLREQVGFFPEGPRMVIEDLTGYPASQFTVAIAESKRMRIRIPVVANGYYLGDVIAEYKLP